VLVGHIGTSLTRPQEPLAGLCRVEMTLDDHERPKHTVAEKTFYGAHQKKLNDCRPILSAAKCRLMIIVSRNDSGVVEDGNFHRFH